MKAETADYLAKARTTLADAPVLSRNGSCCNCNRGHHRL